MFILLLNCLYSWADNLVLITLKEFGDTSFFPKYQRAEKAMPMFVPGITSFRGLTCLISIGKFPNLIFRDGPAV